MSKVIVAAYDPRRMDRAPVHFGATLARLIEGRLVVASVVSGTGTRVDGEPPDADLREECAAAVQDIEADLRSSNLPVECVQVRGRSAAQALHEFAEQEDPGLLAVGASRRAIAGRVLLGGTALPLFNGAPCPIAVVPAEWPARAAFRTIGVAYVETDEGRAALRGAQALALALAGTIGATMRVVTVLIPSALEMASEASTYVAGQLPKTVEDVEGEHAVQLRRRVERDVAALGGDVPAEIDVFVGDPETDPAEHLIRVTEHLDLLVCGSRGYGPVRAVLLGSVSARVTAEAQCPVIVLPRGVKASLEALVSAAPGAAAAT
ncbi:MAG: UspA domain protein [Solirubrobacterales bacterium]|nr:UspA domain protein [Solirubrobacterales bacterium]